MAGNEPPIGGATPKVTPELLIQAYAQGVFPMAEGRASDDIFWVDPTLRGVLPLHEMRLSRSLRRRIRAQPYRITFDRDFAGVVAGCSARDETWINATIAGLYEALHQGGLAHSVELWEDDRLSGGVYGVSLGAAFFGESMFSAGRDASKIGLVYLIDRLRQGGYVLFDTQFLTPHLERLGAIEIPRATYRARLDQALGRRAAFDAITPVDAPDQVLQRMTQTS